jgi:hypothetical protein
MIPFEELEKALARWKARSQNAAVEAAREFEASGAAQVDAGSTPAPQVVTGDHTGEVDLESVVETYEEN